MPRYLRPLIVGILALTGLISGTAFAQTVHTVNQVGFTFSPNVLEITAGDAVEWLWGSGSHTVTNGTGSGDPEAGTIFDVPLNSANPSYVHVFSTPGSYPYHCTPHQGLGMTGEVVVTAPPEPVFWKGAMVSPLGVATLELTPDDHLVVSNIGSSGLDGVSIELPEATREDCLIWDIQDGGENGSVSVEMVGTMDGVVGPIGTTTYTEVDGGGVEVTADYSPLGSPTQRIQIWNGLSLEADFPGQSGVLAVYPSFQASWEGYISIEPGGGETSGYAIADKVFSVQPIAAGPLGDTYLGDRVMIFPEGPGSTVDDLQGIVVLCSRTGDLVLQDLMLNMSLSPVEETLPRMVVLNQNIPNPFNPSTTIHFDLPRAQMVSLRVYDLSGRLVDVLLDDHMGHMGPNEIVWAGRDQTGRPLPSGAYFYSLEVGENVETKRMTLLK